MKIAYTADDERNEQVLTACWNDSSQCWYDDHIDEYDNEDYEDMKIIC